MNRMRMIITYAHTHTVCEDPNYDIHYRLKIITHKLTNKLAKIIKQTGHACALRDESRSGTMFIDYPVCGAEV
jgi:hypothetical protein